MTEKTNTEVDDKTAAGEFSWSEDFKENQNKDKKPDNKMEWMKFDHPGKYNVRLVAKGVEFLKYFKPFGKGVRVITHKSYKDEDPAWLAGFYPNRTFAIHVIDRADGKLKILEKGKGLFKFFAKDMEVNERNPAGKNGSDWEIDVVWPNGDKMLAKYTATAKAKAAPFTDEEVKMIKESLAPLRKIYKATPLEKIKELWNALPDSAKVPPPKKEYDNSGTSGYEKKPAVTAENVTAKAKPEIVEPEDAETPEAEVDTETTGKEEDDLFGDGEKSDSPF